MTKAAIALLACLWVAGWSQPARAQAVQRVEGGRVSVSVSDVPFGQLLRELAGLASATLRIDPAVEDHLVSLDLRLVDVRTALSALLSESTVNYVAVGLETRGPVRIVVGDPRAAVDAEVRTAATTTDDKLKALDVPLGRAADPTPEEDARHKEDERISGEIAERPGNNDVPGQVTSEEWLRVLTRPDGQRTQRQGVVTLPFVDESGAVMQQDVGAVPPTMALLPFTDASGQPLLVPAVHPTGAPVLLPFSDRGAPVFVPAAPAVAATRPGVR